MGLSEPCEAIFQPPDREHDQLETDCGPLPPHMLREEVKILKGGDLSGAGMDGCGGKVSEKDKMGVGKMPNPRAEPCSDAAGETFQTEAEEEVGWYEQMWN